MTNHDTHISVAHGDSAVITVTPTDDGRWFRVLNWIIDAGHWAFLPDTQRNVLIVIARHRREDGLSAAGLDAICAGSGLAKQTTYKALAGLLAHTPALLAKHGPELWELFPGRSYAGRVKSPARDSSLQLETPVSSQRLLRVSPSHSPSAQKDQKDKTERQKQQQRPLSENLARGQERAAAAAEELGRKAGIPGAKAAELIAEFGAAKVFSALVECKARKGAPIRDAARWVRAALSRGYDVQDHWAMEQARQDRAERLRLDAAKDIRAMLPQWNAIDREAVVEHFGSAERLAEWLELEPFGMAWRSYCPPRLGRKIADAVGAMKSEVRA